MPRQGQTFAFRDLNIEEIALFLNKQGACFTLKGHFLLRKKGNFHLEKRALLGRRNRGGGGGGREGALPWFRRP